jgi:hypothetical protein
MADIRIKDLTTTASTTAADDFFAADGATNGTRKLSAYSPTFGGNATVGGTLTVSGASVNSSGTNSVVKSTDGAVVTKVQSVLGSTLGIVGTESNHDLGVYTNNTNRLNISAAGVVSISGTTASTTTSSGALVVGNGTSGGLGVGGALYVGSAGTFGGTVRVSTANGTAATFSLLQAGQQQWAVEIPASTTNLRLRAVDAAVDALTLGTNGNLTGAGSITTAAPTGGTAAAWKLGAVATVSPTSPNRTIEVDIGGTIYYIHAKTTNN